MITAEQILAEARKNVHGMDEIDRSNSGATYRDRGRGQISQVVQQAVAAGLTSLQRGNPKQAAACLGEALVMIEDLL